MRSFRSFVVQAVCVGMSAPGALMAGDLPPIAQLRTFHVNSPTDGVDAVPGDKKCNVLTDPNEPALCTLRAAVMEGNTYGTGWNVEVVLKPGEIYVLSIPGPQEQAAKTGDLDILRPMRIGVPAGQENATIDANELDRGFHFVETPGNSNLYGVTVIGGVVANGRGVAVYSTAENLTIERSVFDQNNTPGLDYAGAMEVGGGRLTLRDSSISDNGAKTSALDIIGVTTEARIERSTVANNRSSGVSVREGAHFEMVSSTVSGNGFVGLDVTPGSSAVIRHSTIVDSGRWGLRAYAYGGLAAVVELRNSVVSGDAGSPACDVDATDDDVLFVSEANVYNDMSCISDTVIDGSLHSTDANLSPLGMWGGPTPTHTPLPDSPVIDNATADLCQDDATDQRGLLRPVAYERNVEPRCDTGAVELEALLPPEEPWVAEIFSDGFES